MHSGYTTIIVPILNGHVEELRGYLRSSVEPRFDATKIVRCRPSLPFDKIQNLHFCSFVILDADPEFHPYLVFDATFDGPLDDFLRDLLRIAPEAMQEIYRHCEGYPETGPAVLELIKNHLADHDVGANVFFRGSPGRTVAQIKGEGQLREKLTSFLSNRWQWWNKAMPATPSKRQHELQDVVRHQTAVRWAEPAAAVPWEVAWRNQVAAAGVLAIAAVICVLGALILGLFGQGALHVDTGWLNAVSGLGKYLLGGPHPPWLVALNRFLHFEVTAPLLMLVVLWLACRFVELLFEDADPRKRSFYGSYISYFFLIARYALDVAFVGYATLSFVPGALSQDQAFMSDLAPFNPSKLELILRLAIVGSLLLILRYWAVSLALAVQLRELTPAGANWRRLLLDWVHFTMILVALYGAYAVFSWLIPSGSQEAVGYVLSGSIRVLLVLAVYLFVGSFIIYVLIGLVFLAVRAMERGDRKRFADAEELTNRLADNAAAFAREEGGTNTYQNHLTSLTYVKPSRLRAWFLWFTLFVIGLLSRFWFNVGELGGIPTILSARWVLIDDGQRLLFLDHYGGAWDSYLNEFIDMGAVLGLNAIWTNTFIKVDGTQHAFPDTKYYFWKGAQVERPFKAYVRQSQVETIVWFSAYPRPSIVNINANTNLRQSSFKPLASCEVDTLVQNL